MSTLETTIDFETRSRCNLKKAGASKYAKHPSTQATLLAYSIAGTLYQWRLNLTVDGPELHGPERMPGRDTMGCPPRLAEHIAKGGLLYAFNAPFEVLIWQHVCHERWGWPAVPLEQWRCSMARAAYCNQPQSLDKAALRLVGEKKVDNAKQLIALLTKPQKMTKKRLAQGLSEWERDEEKWREFAIYNKGDVKLETAVDARLLKWHPDEILLWQQDRAINQTGIYIDYALCRGARRIYRVAQEKANAELAQITGGVVTKYTQVQRILQWLNKRVKYGESLKESLVNEWLASDRGKAAPADVKRVIELRQNAASNTVTKYITALERVEKDSRTRESLRYHRTATGRWGGSGFHPHNFKREKIPAESYFRAIRTGDYEIAEAFAADLGVKDPIGLLKKCVRGIIKAPRGKMLVVSDFAGIEARVLHWLVGNERMLELFRRNQDVYIENACAIYGVQHEEIATWDKKEGKWVIKPEFAEYRQIGKQAELGLGYNMGAKKFIANVWNQAALKISEEFSNEVVYAWRAANPLVADYWKKMSRFFLHTMKEKKSYRLDRLKFHYTKAPIGQMGYLQIELPSGRRLHYYNPHQGKDPTWGSVELRYWDGSKKEKGQKFLKTYGGKLIENVVQAISRDLLVNSMRICLAAGLRVVFHVHDELVVEIDKGDKAAAKLVHEAMETVPDWAKGLPLMAETGVKKRYSK